MRIRGGIIVLVGQAGEARGGIVKGPRILVFHKILHNPLRRGHGATTLALVGRLQLAGTATRLAGVPQRQPLTDPA